MTTNHPAHGPLSLDRLHQIRETLSNAAAQSDGGNLGYAMADAVKVIDGVLERRKTDNYERQPSPALKWLSESYLVHLVSLHRRPVFRHENGDIMLSCQTIACFVDEYFAERRTFAYRQYLYAKLLILDKPNESGYLAHLGETPRLKPRGIHLLNAMFNRFGFMIEEFGGYENLLKHLDKEIAGGEPSIAS